MTDAPPRAAFRRWRFALALVGLAVLGVALALYAARRIIAREALTHWLQSKGIASEAEVQAFGLKGFTGRLRIGDPKNPDFTAEQAEVAYGFRGFSLEVRSVTLRRPVLRARLHDGKLSVGALDPLIAEFRSKPPRPDAAKPRIDIRDGLLLLATDYGPVRLTADARVEDEKLVSLEAVGAPTHLAGKGFDAQLGATALTVRTRGDRVQANLSAISPSTTASGTRIEGAELKLALDAPYPDLKKRRGDGAVNLRLNLTGRRLALAGESLSDAQLSAGFEGQSTGWISDLTVAGRGALDVRAGGAAVGELRTAALRATAAVEDVRWTRKGGDAVSARISAQGRLDALTAQDLRLQAVAARAQGPLAFDSKGARLNLSVSTNGRGGWTGLGDPTAADSADIRAVKRAARNFAFAAPDLRLVANGPAASVRLTAPVRLTPAAGGLIQAAQQGAAYVLTIAGGGLPDVRAEVQRLTLTAGEIAATGRARAALSIGPIEHGRFDAVGQLRIAGGATAFSATQCVSMTAEKLELGDNDVTKVSGQLCPSGAPVLTLGDGRWRINGAARDVAADAPFLQAHVSAGRGQMNLAARGEALDADMRIAAATVTDLAPERRFEPLTLSGRAGLAREIWSGTLLFRDAGGHQLAQAILHHDGRSEAGGVDIDTGLLAFAEGGLQPGELSPMAAALGSPVTGTARFKGALGWTPAGTTSQGVLTIPRLDFTSPAGRVTGLSGEIAFTSLTPLVAAPGQVLRAEGLQAIVPLTGVTATFGIEGEALHVSGGEAAVGGGRVSLERLEIPFKPRAPTTGVLIVDGVQLHDLVEASPFGDKVDMDAKVSGRIPFQLLNGQVHVQEGALRAIEPGRLSIQREALTGVATSDAVATTTSPLVPGWKETQPPPDTFTDFAYQAMENLAFDTLDASINSLPEGRVGVLFHIIGRHDPPQHQEIRLTLMDLITRRFLQRQLPLPSGTGVNLTLDTTLNLDQLLADYAEYQRLRSSAPVQP